MPLTSTPLPPRRWLRVGLLFLGIHQVATLQLWLYARAADPGATWWGAAIVEGSLWFTWLALLPAVAWNVRTHPPGGGWRSSAAWNHAAVAAGIIGLHLILMPTFRSLLESLLLPAAAGGGAGGLRPYGQSSGPWWAYLDRIFSARGLAWAAGDLLWYTALAAGYQWLDAKDRLRLQELREADLRAQAVRAQLEALRHRLEPHFLFNALNALGALIRTEPSQAETMLEALACLFRQVLRLPETPVIPLGEELALVQSYLEVERFRFGPDLSFHVELGPDCELAVVPSLLLQPLVENAIRHGLAPKGGPGQLWIRIHRQGPWLDLRVEDDGPGPGSSTPPDGMGLAITRARLQTLYGPAASLDTGPRPGGGFRADLRLPAVPPPGWPELRA